MSGLVRPLWFLDIDGVVNALRPRDGLSATKARTSGETWPIHWPVEVVQLINTVLKDRRTPHTFRDRPL